MVAALTVLVTAKLSAWQFQRAAEKEAMQAQFEKQQMQPLRQLLTGVDPGRDRYARVQLPGRFDPRLAVMHDNQILDKRAGVHAYAVFLPDETGVPAILVNRGWMPLPAQRDAVQAPSLRSEAQELQGRINVPAARTKRLTSGTDTASLVQIIELEKLSAQFKRPLAPYIIEQTGADGSGLRREWTQPDFKIATHKMYAGQWACFSALAALLWLVLSFPKRSTENR
jgi:surfeit locus 1 family protein